MVSAFETIFAALVFQSVETKMPNANNVKVIALKINLLIDPAFLVFLLTVIEWFFIL
jgi:hypothetical protein